MTVGNAVAQDAVSEPAAPSAPVSIPQIAPLSAPPPSAATSLSPVLTGAKPKAASFYGLTASQVEARFGKPDQKISKTDGAEEWSYGKSVLFFLSGKVNAWSDAGELNNREEAASLKKAPVDHDDALSGDWPNPWTPGKKEKDLDFLGQ
ncbi:MAG: hypothetical protein U0136_09725 [Bdellovibrionota bacterium]